MKRRFNFSIIESGRRVVVLFVLMLDDNDVINYHKSFKNDGLCAFTRDKSNILCLSAKMSFLDVLLDEQKDLVSYGLKSI